MRFAGEDGWNVPIKRLVVEGFAAADLVAVASAESLFANSWTSGQRLGRTHGWSASLTSSWGVTEICPASLPAIMAGRSRLSRNLKTG